MQVILNRIPLHEHLTEWLVSTRPCSSTQAEIAGSSAPVGSASYADDVDAVEALQRPAHDVRIELFVNHQTEHRHGSGIRSDACVSAPWVTTFRVGTRAQRHLTRAVQVFL